MSIVSIFIILYVILFYFVVCLGLFALALYLVRLIKKLKKEDKDDL